MPFRRLLPRHSLIVRLWLTLNLIFVCVAAVGMTAYIGNRIRGDIAEAKEDVAIREETLVVMSQMTARVIAAEGSFRFTASDSAVLRRLGVYKYDLFNSDGVAMLQMNPWQNQILITPSYFASLPAVSVESTGSEMPAGATVVAQISTEPASAAAVEILRMAGSDSRVVSMNDGHFLDATQDLGAWDVLRGGNFAEELWFGDGSGFAQRTYISLPALTSDARSVAVQASLVVLLVWAVMNPAGLFLLRRLIFIPLQQYGRVAKRIASGEPLRMPVHGHDELADLASAVNAMADVLESKATIDPLTGLHNLRHLSNRLEAMIAEATRTGNALSVLIADLDNFKPINDTYGHAAGDAVLKAVGETIQRWASPDFVCWRQGGDEFAVAMPNRTFGEALEAGSRLQRLVAALSVTVSDGLAHASISYGVATMPEDGISAGALVGVADRQMYLNKDDRLRRSSGLPRLSA